MTPPSLSYWEHKHYFSNLDFLVLGAGIVGKSSAYHLKKKYPKAKILIVERDLISAAASSKNAGFACFGSPSELLNDLDSGNSDRVWATVEKRWKGLRALENWLGASAIDLQINGSWDLFDKTNKHLAEKCIGQLSPLNVELSKITGKKQTFIVDDESITRFGLKGFDSAIKNQLEGQIDTSKLLGTMKSVVAAEGILELHGIKVESYNESSDGVQIQSNIGDFKASQLIICSNGFSKSVLPNCDVEPARAQVLMTKPIQNLPIKGTFHIEGGYYYFRNIDNRILLGGGRNLDFDGENTDQFGHSDIIMNRLEALLREHIIPNQAVEIEHTWSGIMGVGTNKEPIVQRISPRVACGIKMGGMGIAIGTQIGIDLANMID